MLSSELLRTKTSRGTIIPLFCATNLENDGNQHDLANKIIRYFTNAHKSNQSKGDLLEKIAPLESKHDYKLVRGLYTLLERRSIFENMLSDTLPKTINPFLVRQKLFTESAYRGLALSDSQRNDIIESIAAQMHISSDQIKAIMWSDKDVNLTLTHFDSISPKDLLLWYNQSLAQTLLFRCTTLRFNLQGDNTGKGGGGGLYWKEVLRNVKRYGLMYNLEYNGNTNNPDSITCVLEGPLSLFRMTDRYGTMLAKLLPSIIRTPAWQITGSITKRTDDGQKIYHFDLSNENTMGFLRSVYVDKDKDENNIENSHIYDSILESTFVKKFYQHFDQHDKLEWKISREPGPLIANGKAMIPDFLLEKFGRKVYLEIVGFWTRDYIERKATKLKAIFNESSKTGVDLLVIVNSELACSQITNISSDHIFTFNKEISIKPILEHLKKIDTEIVEEKTQNTRIDLDKQDDNIDLISIEKISNKYNIPKKAVIQIMFKNYPQHIKSGLYLISKKRIDVIKNSLKDISKFVDACDILLKYEIPESCHADLLSKLDYDVIWNDLDPNNAKIILKSD